MKLSADESILQLITWPALEVLGKFNAAPTHVNASALADVSVVHKILDYELHIYSHIPVPTLQLCIWLHHHAMDVLF
jgi:hypothetical protein